MWSAAFRVSTQRVTDALLRKAVLPAGTKAFERVSGAMSVRMALAAKAREQTLFFIVPEATASPARQITAALLIGDHAHAHGENELPADEVRRLLKGDVLLVSQAVSETKNTLDELPIGPYHRLKDCWDVVLASRDMPAKGDKPRLLVANPGWVRKSTAGRRFGAVIVDASHPRTIDQVSELVRLARGCSSFCVVVGPPLPETTLRACGFPNNAKVWYWDPQAQAEAELATETGDGLANLAERKLWVCESDGDVSQSLERLYKALCSAAKAANGSNYPGLQHAWGIYNRFRQLVVPLVHLEQSASETWAGNLRSRIDALQSFEGYGIPAWDSTWPALVEAIQEAYALLLKREETAKFWGMAEAVERFVASKGELLRLVLPTESEVDLVTPLLGRVVDGFADAITSGRIEVLTSAQEARLIAEGQTAQTVLVGPRARNRHLDFFPSKAVDVLAYPHEVAIERGHLAKSYEAWLREANDDKRAEILEPLGLRRPRNADRVRTATVPPIVVTNASGHEVAHALASEREMEIDLDLLVAGKQSGAATQFRPGLHVGTGDTVEVSFEGGSRAVYYANQNVDVFFPATQELRRCAPPNLQVGWKVVTFVDGRYDTLFQRLMEVISARRPFKERLSLEAWATVKRKLAARHSSKKALYERLAERGLSASYETFTSWFRDGDEETLAPQHFQEFALIAQESGAFATPKMLRDTFDAIQRERGRNRAAGRMLKNYLRATISGDGPDEALASARKFDSALGDVLVAVEVLEVTAVRVTERRNQ